MHHRHCFLIVSPQSAVQLSPISCLLYDAVRLLTEFSRPIRGSALHVYHTALLLAPDCALKRHYLPISPLQASLSVPHQTSWEPIRWVLEGHVRRINALCASSDGNRVISSADDRRLYIWDFDAQIGEYRRKMIIQRHVINSLFLTPDGSEIVGAGDGRVISIYDTSTGEAKAVFDLEHDSVINAISLSPDASTIASASNDKTLRLWSKISGECIVTLMGHTDSRYGPSYFPTMAWSSSPALEIGPFGPGI